MDFECVAMCMCVSVTNGSGTYSRQVEKADKAGCRPGC